MATETCPLGHPASLHEPLSAYRGFDVVRNPLGEYVIKYGPQAVRVVYCLAEARVWIDATLAGWSSGEVSPLDTLRCPVSPRQTDLGSP